MMESIAEDIVLAYPDRDTAVKTLAKAIDSWLPVDEDPDEAAAAYVDRIAPLVYGTGAQYKSSSIDYDAGQVASGKMSVDLFKSYVRMSIPDSRRPDLEEIAAAALEKARAKVAAAPKAA